MWATLLTRRTERLHFQRIRFVVQRWKHLWHTESRAGGLEA